MKIKNMTDEECLNAFLKLLEKRVTLNTAFIKDEDTGTLTHQIIQVSCGDFVSVSEPEPLAVPLSPATGEELGVTVN